MRGFAAQLAPEAVYLHDAHALDWLGAIGVARIIALQRAEQRIRGFSDLMTGP
jgi:hypothetical protein